jgi:thiosulfate dehydrogenase (quinone) large subunit
MSTIHDQVRDQHPTHIATESTGLAASGTDAAHQGVTYKALAVLRIAFGVTFLWAFFDKLLALGFSTGALTNEAGVKTGTDFFAKDSAWLNGGSPTEGFLAFGVPAHNPFKGMFNSMAGDTWVNVLFMMGLLGIGLALTFGIGIRVGAACGALMYLFMYAASLPLENNPVVDERLLGAISMVVLGLTLAGDTWGFGRAWAKTGLVKTHSILR